MKERLGKQITKETFHRQVKKGEAQYVSPKIQARASNTRFVKQYIPAIVPRHLNLIHKWYEVGWNGLNDKERVIFRNLFSQYNRDDVRQALGSAPQDTGAFSMT